MMMLENKRSYKVISLLVKTAILIFSLYYIWQKLNEANETIDFKNIVNSSNTEYLLLVSILMLLNWGIEAFKWKLLISPLETISYSKSFKSIFSGVTVSIFTPSRVGEFVGRIFFLEHANKIQASLKSFIGSIIQLFITVIAGLIAYFVLDVLYHDFFRVKQFISFNSCLFLVFCFIISVAIIGYVYSKRNKELINYKKYIDAFTDCPASILVVIFCLSMLRYFVFTFQYYLILKFFGINAGVTILFSLIALTFFVTSVIPTFSITEITVRGATAVYFFGTISTDSTAIVASSLLLWIINLAIPALIGCVFILKLKLIKN